MDAISVLSQRMSTRSDNDNSESGFEAEPILPSQFFEGRKKDQALEPEKRLMLAVLTDAVHSYQVGCDMQKTSRDRVFLEAEQWLFSAKGYGPFSCENVCNALDLSPEYLRKMLREWRVPRIRGARVRVVRRAAG